MRLESLSLVDISLRRSTKQDEIVPRLFNGVKQKRLRLEKFTARSPLQQFKINTRVLLLRFLFYFRKERSVAVGRGNYYVDYCAIIVPP